MNQEIELVEQQNETPPEQIMYSRRKFWDLLKLMLIKNYLIFKRQYLLTTFLMSSPLLICLIVLLIQQVVNGFTQFLILDPPVKCLISAIPRCTSEFECVSIGYFVVGSQETWIENVMKRVAITNNLIYDEDVRLIKQVAKPTEITQYLNDNMNQTQIAVVFCTSQWEIALNISLPCQFEKIEKKIVFYTIMYNYTLLYKSPYLQDMKLAYPKDAYASKLKLSLDNAILREFGKIEKEEDEEFIYVTQKDYPIIPNRFISNMDVAGNYGAFYFFAPYLLNFLILINELLQEKGKKLRQGLTVMGLTHTVYWISWTITALFIVMVMTVSLIGLGHLFQFDFFTKSPFIVLFVLYTTFGFSIALLAFFITTVCPDVKNGYTIAYGFILLALLMQMCFTQTGMSVLFYRSDASIWVEVVRGILSLYPAFKYSLIYADISIKSCRHYSLEEGRWVEGEGFKYSDLYETNSGKVQLDNTVKYSSPDPITNYGHLLISCLFYIILTYYFDHILESNRGKGDSIFFFITKPLSYCRRKKNNKILLNDLQTTGPSDSAEKEKQSVIKNFGKVNDGLQIVGLSKTYYRYPCSIPSKYDVHALKDVYLELHSGELLALLGHNGAGKTTLIGLITGMFRATRGTAQLEGMDINDDMDAIRNIMGVCPQFDILWNQLTAAEHLRMYCAIKGLHPSTIESEVDRRLSQVELLHVKDAQIQTFSGGMKRRVSLAISAIGNPKIIILDEPTTGMDPKARRQVWKMIKNLKQDRVVLLTTHAMEEADVLADRIAVLADGTLKAVGTSLYMKNQFSDGYRISMVSDDADKCITQLRTKLGDFKILDNSGGSILISIPFSQNQKLEAFFQIVENEHTQYHIKDWGLSHATLEEVFMRVTKV